MAESVSDMLSWARYVDHGIQLLGYSLERKEIKDDEVDSNEVMQMFQQIIDDARTLKISAQNDVDQLKVMSGELKDLISRTESEEVMTIDQDLKTMLDTLFPNEVVVEEPLQVTPIEAEHSNVDDGNLYAPPLAEPAALSPGPSQESYPEESFAEVEITPGLIKKVPKSQVVTDDLIPLSHRFDHFVRPIRKKTLVFSPGDLPRPGRSPIPDTKTPQEILQDRTNFHSARAGGKANCEITAEDTSDPPEFLERPRRPVLTLQRDGLLRCFDDI